MYSNTQAHMHTYTHAQTHTYLQKNKHTPKRAYTSMHASTKNLLAFLNKVNFPFVLRFQFAWRTIKVKGRICACVQPALRQGTLAHKGMSECHSHHHRCVLPCHERPSQGYSLVQPQTPPPPQDRKTTRLNSSNR